MFFTQNPIGSSATEDLQDNAISFDYAMNSPAALWQDRFGKQHKTVQQALKDVGFKPAGFDFVSGGTLGLGDRDKCVFYPTDGYWYSWNGKLPYVVPANSSPTPGGKKGWVLREELSLVKQIHIASLYGFDGSDTDFYSLFKNFMSEPGKKVIDVDIKTSKMANVSDGSVVVSYNNSKIIVLGDVTNDQDASINNQGQVLESGNNCTFIGLTIDGRNNLGGGILNEHKNNVTIQLCEIFNSLGQSILDLGGYNAKYLGNTLYKSLHGIQLWLTQGAKVGYNHIYQVTGGIWSAVGQGIIAFNNTVHDCSDVGIDWEGGMDCHSYQNTIHSCAHGEVAIFPTGPELVHLNILMGNLSHNNNNIRRISTFINKEGEVVQNDIDDVGAICIYGMDTGMSGPIEIKGNTICVESETGVIPGALNAIHTRAIINESVQYLDISKNNVVTSSSCAFRIQEINKLKFVDNTFLFKGINPVRHEIKNTHTGLIKLNTFIFDGTSAPNVLLYLYTDKPMRGNLYIKNNDFSNAGPTAIAVDQYVSSRVIALVDNQLPTSPNGGIVCINGFLSYKNQKMNIPIGNSQQLDISNITGIYKSSSIGFGNVAIQMGGVGTVYRVCVQTMDISGNVQLTAIDPGNAYNTGLFPDPARKIDFSGTTLTPVDTDPNTNNSALLSLELNSRF